MLTVLHHLLRLIELLLAPKRPARRLTREHAASGKDAAERRRCRQQQASAEAAWLLWERYKRWLLGFNQIIYRLFAIKVQS